MNPIDVVRIASEGALAAANLLLRFPAWIEYRTHRAQFARNQALRGRYAGARCVVLGNGPSINALDLSVLRGVPTFVVNGFHHSDKYDEVDPRFHCFCDERVIRENRDSIVPYMARRKDKTSYFFYQRGIGVVPEGENVYFVHSKIWPTSSKLRCDLSQTANAWINVIPFAVMCAIHLGFTQIDLLGCDFSLFASRKDAHFYDASNAAQRRESLYQDLQGHAIACRQHEYLRDYAAARGIQIRNATPGSLLDVYPRIDIDELVLRKEAP